MLVYPKGVSRSPCPKEVPDKIAEDYKESCLVLSDSPKASAALSRRCLQNVLREAAKVKPGDLYDEIQEILDSRSLPSQIAEGLDAVRAIGNFGTYPIKSKHTGEIMPVETGEAEWNLDVLESLFDFYFVQPAVMKAKKDALNKKLQAKRLGVLDTINPIAGVSIPRAKEQEETYAYGLGEIKKMLAVLNEPARTVVLTAALTGLRKGEIWGLRWEDFNGRGRELNVNRSIWFNVVNEPKTRGSRRPVPVVKELAEALERHRARMGKLAVGPIFQAGNRSALNLDNLARRVIAPALDRCLVCQKQKNQHKSERHLFQRNEALPRWHGWHAFRRGLATNLHYLHVDDKTIQAILRHSNIGLTQNVYIKSVAESEISAMDLLGAELRKPIVTNLSPNRAILPN
jgi:integrase